MPVSSKDRNTLWTRSGGHCAFCRTELIKDEDNNKVNLNIGDECHIISSKPNGPRYQKDYNGGFDKYDNLILLCKNHHRMIDEQHQTFDVKILKLLKLNHERWVKELFKNATNKKTSKSRYLKRITSGKELLDIVESMHASEFDYDELKTAKEVKLIGDFLQNLRDWADLFAMGVIETSEAVKIGFDFTKELREIEDMGFVVFGDRRKARIKNGKNDDLGVWNIARIEILRENNPRIINFEKLLDEYYKNDN